MDPGWGAGLSHSASAPLAGETSILSFAALLLLRCLAALWTCLVLTCSVVEGVADFPWADNDVAIVQASVWARLGGFAWTAVPAVESHAVVLAIAIDGCPLPDWGIGDP